MAKHTWEEVSQEIEKAVVGAYQKIEEGVVDGYKKIEDGAVERFFARDGEPVEEAKAQLRRQQGKEQEDIRDEKEAL